MSLAVGDLPPSFCLEGVDGTTGEPVTVELDSTRGSPVVVAFYPADDSPVCTAQLSDYSASIASLHDLGAQVLAISPQSPRSHAAFAAARGGFEFPLLSDEDRSVAASWGNLGLLDLYRRSTFVLGADGRVAWMHRSVGPGLTYTPVPELLEVLESLR